MTVGLESFAPLALAALDLVLRSHGSQPWPTLEHRLVLRLGQVENPVGSQPGLALEPVMTLRHGWFKDPKGLKYGEKALEHCLALGLQPTHGLRTPHGSAAGLLLVDAARPHMSMGVATMIAAATPSFPQQKGRQPQDCLLTLGPRQAQMFQQVNFFFKFWFFLEKVLKSCHF